MENILTEIERENNIREIFLNIFKEDGVSKEELENAICESYRKEGIKCDTIKDIPIKERPRERLKLYGKENVSNEELLSIILNTGVKNKSVKELSNSILSKMNDISDLKNMTLNN